MGLLYSRCYAVHKCVKEEEKKYEDLAKGFGGDDKLSISTFSRNELRKNYPDRYPTNSDSIGVEIVSRYVGPDEQVQDFEHPTKQ